MSGTARVQVPSEDGAHLAQPPLSQVGELLQHNRRTLSQISTPILGRPWADLSALARREVLNSSREYFAANDEPSPESTSERIVMTGHQPELFHPGVWVKNFALRRIADEHGCNPVHLIVDNDVIKSNALRVPPPTQPLPSVDDLAGGLTPIYYSTSLLGVPFEEGGIADADLFASVPARVAANWGFVPMLQQFWRRAALHPSRNLGERFAVARRHFETKWGCKNFEARVSDACRTEAFAWFACDLLANLERLHAAYNGGLADHRRERGIKNRARPIADLQRDGDWLEAPFWAWKRGARQRARLWAKKERDRLLLRADDATWPSLPWDANRDPAALVSAYRDLERTEHKIRARALTNTLYQRLFVADLFIHGIGGGKYDEVTDQIMTRYYGIEPPRFMILSGTLRLPLPRIANTGADVPQLRRLLRDLHCNPQRHLTAAAVDAVTLDLARQKEEWIRRPARTSEERRRRYRALHALTEQLRSAVADQTRRIEQRLSARSKHDRANAMLARRDLAFCLYPEKELRRFCTSLSASATAAK